METDGTKAVRVVAAVLAAGRGVRFGADKVRLDLGGKPVWRWSVDAFLSHPGIDEVILVAPDAESIAVDRVTVVAGGETRKQSSYAALRAAVALGAKVLLVHDAARPFVTQETIADTLAGVEEVGAAAAAVSVVDTIKRKSPDGLQHLDRSELVAMQTPQGARIEMFARAHAAADDSATDDVAMLQSIGIEVRLVEGDERAFKITTMSDFERAKAMIGSSPEFRTGIGYDVHRFSDDPHRPLWLGGVHFPGARALDGHSDADALLHAITDALLGAASLGDIGQHFKNTDPRWSGEPSKTFLAHARKLLAEAGWTIIHVDATVIAEAPKVMKMAEEIRTAVADTLEIAMDRVSIKATTNERMGAIGREEGIAAFATATIRN